MTAEEAVEGPVTEDEMSIAELDERLTALEASVSENTSRLEFHSSVGWAVFILWLVFFVGSLLWLASELRIFGW